MTHWITVTPKPDELAAGHEGRHMLTLGARSRAEHMGMLRSQVESLSLPSDVPRLHLLAYVSGLSTKDYAGRHTMLPVLRVAAKSGQTHEHGSEAAISVDGRNGMLTQRRGAYICRRCVDDDLRSAHAMSWFHRAHHLIGVDWCPVHGEPLHRVEAVDPFAEVPHSFLESQRSPASIGDVTSAESDGFSTRYVQIAVELLKRRRPVNCTAINNILAERARELGLRVCETGRRPLLSDRLLEIADHRWLERHWPGLQSKAVGQSHGRIDQITFARTIPGTGDAYALALTTLYDDAASALAQLARADTDLCAAAHVSESARQRTSTGKDSTYWRGTVWTEYLACRGSHARLAERLGMDRTHVNGRLRAMGLPSLTHAANDRAWHALVRISQGATSADACAEAGADPAELDALVRTCSAQAVEAYRIVYGDTLLTSDADWASGSVASG